MPDAGAEAQVETRDRVRRGRIVTAVVVLVLGALAALVAALGGFADRTDLRTRVAAGAVISTGPYEVSIDHASVAHITSDNTWKVTASGSAQTTGTTSITPYGGTSGFVAARSDLTHEAHESDSIAVNEQGSSDAVGVLTPGLPPVPWSITFEFTQDPGDELVVGIFGQEYTTPYIFGDEMGWEATDDASTITLPIERLPDQEY